MKRIAVFVVAFTAFAFFLHNAAHAQSALPNAANPNLLEKEFTPPEAPKASGAPGIIQSPENITAPPGAEKIHFTLKKLVIDGAAIYQPDDFKTFYENKIGAEISVKDLYDIAQKITAKYDADGWVLSQAIVPPQKIGKNGIATIKIVEGFIDKVSIVGDVKGSKDLLQSYLDKIRAERPLNIKTLERYLLLANDLPGVSASGVLKPSANTPGAADLILTIESKRVDAAFGLNDRGSRYVGPWQSTMSADVNSALGLYDRTGILFATTPFSLQELKYTQVSHDEQLDDEGTKLTASFSNIVSHPGNTLDESGLRTDSYDYNFKLTHPLIRSRAENLNANLQVDWLDSSTDQTEDIPLYRDHLRVLRGGGSYDWVDDTLSTLAVSQISSEISEGLDGLGSSSPGSAFLSRPGGHADFIKGVFDANRTQSIEGPFSLALGGTAQVANAPLLSPEQFTFGGSDFGRGYDPAALSGDDGIAGKAELQYAGPEIPHIQSWMLYTFYDYGRVWQLSPNPASNGGEAMSAGFGARTVITDWASLGAEIAKPLTKSVALTGTAGGDFRGFVDLILHY